MPATAWAGSCSVSAATNNPFCSGPAVRIVDRTARIEGDANEDVVVTSSDDFGIEVTSGNAIEIMGVAGTGGIDVSLTGSGTITAAVKGVVVSQRGSGNVNLDIGQNISATGDAGVDVFEAGVDEVTVTTRGTINSGARGITITGTAGALSNTMVTATSGIEATNEAIRISHYGSGNVGINAAQLTSAMNEGIFVETRSTSGNVEITASGDIMAQTEGIEVDQNGIGTVNITTGGTITSTAEEGIFVDAGSATTGDVEITMNGSINSQKGGIRATHNGSGNLLITTSGSVDSTAGTGIYAITGTSASGNVVLDINGDIAGDNSPVGVAVSNQGSGDVIVGINAEIVQGSTLNSIDLNGGGTHTIVFGENAILNGNIDVDGVTGTARLEIGGTGDRGFDISSIPTIVGDINFHKNGDDVLTITGTHASGAGFVNTHINAGRLVWSGATFQGSDINVADRGAFEVTAAAVFSGNLALSGILELTGNDSSLTLDTLTGNGGSVDINVDFSNGDGDLDTPRLNVTNVDGDSIAVNIMAMGGFPEISEGDEDEAITIGNLISATTTEEGDFVVGRALNEGFNFDIVYDAANNRWDLVAQATEGSIEDALFETLPAALAQLAGLESYQARLAGRQYAGNMAVWGKITGASSEVEPNSTSLTTYDVESAEVEFGINFPLAISNPDIDGDFALGASVAFGDATTDVSILNAGGEISTDSAAIGISVGWEDERAYFDGQLQYASFDNVLEADEKLADIDATAFSASAEIGYALDLARLNAAFLGNLPDITLTPSAQLQWSRIDFKDFTANETGVKLDRGSVIDGRVGVAVEKHAQGILLHGRTNVIMPLDGEVGVIIADEPVTSEREDPVLDIGIGAAYEWDDAYAISADVSTQQGSEIEGYAAKVAFKYGF